MVKGYKVFNPDWTCRGFRYAVGESYEMDGDISVCERGFHFCENLADCFEYYKFDSENKVAEVEAYGEIKTENTKSVTNKIKIVREITWDEVLTICNTGNCNTGDWNTGNWNTGNWNTGDWNKSSFNTGCFNTVEPKIMLFDKPSDLTYRNWIESDACRLLNQIPKRAVEWIDEDDMTDNEKSAYPTYKTTGGYLKTLDESECAQIWWDGLNEDDRDIIRAIPNFVAETFYECTGIKV